MICCFERGSVCTSIQIGSDVLLRLDRQLSKDGSCILIVLDSDIYIHSNQQYWNCTARVGKLVLQVFLSGSGKQKSGYIVDVVQRTRGGAAYMSREASGRKSKARS
jgi:hypothetical protein